MKHSLSILFCLAGGAFAQTAAVTKNPTTNALTSDLVMPGGRTLRVDGTLQTAQTPILFGRGESDFWSGFPAFTSLLSSEPSRHGLICRTTNNAGAAIIGISETGAAAGKFFQIQNFNSPAVWIGRDPSTYPWSDPPITPTLIVSTPADGTVTPIAVFYKNMNDVVLSLGSDGCVTAPFQAYYDSNALVTKGHADQTYFQKYGITNGSEAASGQVGEYQSAATSGPASLVTETAKTVQSLSLGAGDWDIEGIATYTKAAGTVVAYTQQGISLTNNTLGAAGTFTASASAISDAIPSAFITPRVKLNLGSTTTVYLVARAGFSTSTLSATGFIRARRIR